MASPTTPTTPLAENKEEEEMLLPGYVSTET